MKKKLSGAIVERLELAKEELEGLVGQAFALRDED